MLFCWQQKADDYLNSIREVNSSIEEKQHTAQIEAERTVNEAKAQADHTLLEAKATSKDMSETAQKQAVDLKAESVSNAQACIESARKKSEEILAVAGQKRMRLEVSCREKAEETQKELEARWDAFENRVEDVLSQHRELSIWTDLESDDRITYTLTEETVDGYKTTYELNKKDLEENQSFSLGTDGDKITVVNTSDSTYTLPETGGSGTLPFITIGASLMDSLCYVDIQ